MSQARYSVLEKILCGKIWTLVEERRVRSDRV